MAKLLLYSFLITIGIVILCAGSNNALPLTAKNEVSPHTTKVTKTTRTKFLEELEQQIDEMDKEISQKLVNALLTNSRAKRSDIDERLFELQAKYLLTKAYANMPVGHGRFNLYQL